MSRKRRHHHVMEADIVSKHHHHHKLQLDEELVRYLQKCCSPTPPTEHQIATLQIQILHPQANRSKRLTYLHDCLRHKAKHCVERLHMLYVYDAIFKSLKHTCSSSSQITARLEDVFGHAFLTVELPKLMWETRLWANQSQQERCVRSLDKLACIWFQSLHLIHLKTYIETFKVMNVMTAPSHEFKPLNSHELFQLSSSVAQLLSSCVPLSSSATLNINSSSNSCWSGQSDGCWSGQSDNSWIWPLLSSSSSNQPPQHGTGMTVCDWCGWCPVGSDPASSSSLMTHHLDLHFQIETAAEQKRQSLEWNATENEWCSGSGGGGAGEPNAVGTAATNEFEFTQKDQANLPSSAKIAAYQLQSPQAWLEHPIWFHAFVKASCKLESRDSGTAPAAAAQRHCSVCHEAWDTDVFDDTVQAWVFPFAVLVVGTPAAATTSACHIYCLKTLASILDCMTVKVQV